MGFFDIMRYSNRRIDEEVNLDDVFEPDIIRTKDGRTFGRFALNKKAFKDEDTRAYKDVIRKNGGRWWKTPADPESGRWIFSDGSTDARPLLNTKVKPVLDEISKENNYPDEPTRQSEILRVIDELLKKFETSMNSGPRGVMASAGEHTDKEDVKRKLEELKAKLISITSAEEFKEVMRPILVWHSAQEMIYSFPNMLLVYLQDPEAKYVQPAARWQSAHRVPVPGAKFVGMWHMTSIPYSASNKEAFTRDYLLKHRKTHISELNDVERTNLKTLLAKGIPTGHYTWKDDYVDVRFTRNFNGEKDDFDDFMQGKDAMRNLKWFDDSGEPTDDTIGLAQAIEEVCKDHGITITRKSKEELRGARGYSADGGKTIAMMDGAQENEDYLKTLVHELTHSLCHWENSKFPLKDARDIQEQEAELTAWMVLMMFGYEAVTNTAMNYIGSWGLTEKNAVKVFDTMAKVATYIVREIKKKLNPEEAVSEGFIGNVAKKIGGAIKNAGEFIKRKLMGGGITGRELAVACGMGALYDRSKEFESKADSMDDMERDDEAMVGRFEDGYDPEGSGEIDEYGLS